MVRGATYGWSGGTDYGGTIDGMTVHIMGKQMFVKCLILIQYKHMCMHAYIIIMRHGFDKTLWCTKWHRQLLCYDKAGPHWHKLKLQRTTDINW